MKEYTCIIVLILIAQQCHACQKAVLTPKKVTPLPENETPKPEQTTPEPPKQEEPKVVEAKVDTPKTPETTTISLEEPVKEDDCELKDKQQSVKKLVDNLTARLFGQHIATSIVSRAIKSHIENPVPSKALVLSFHGSSGIGKSFSIKLIAEALFKDGFDSPYVHHIRLGSPQIQSEKSFETFISSSLEQCGRSLFVFEADHIPSNILNFLHNFVDYYGQFKSHRAIFILISKEGGNEINDIAIEASLSEMKREDLKMDHFEKIVTNAAYNGKGGLSRSILIDRGLIDIFVPFLPLEKKHVKQCIQEHLRNLEKDINDDKVERIAEAIQYFAGRFASTGCMKIIARSSLILDEDATLPKKEPMEIMDSKDSLASIHNEEDDDFFGSDDDRDEL